MKKVLFVATVGSHIEAFHLPYIIELKKRGYLVDVACNTARDIVHANATHRITFSRKIFALDNLKAYFELKRLLSENEYDIVHTHTPIASAFSRNILKKSKTKVIYTAHGFHFYKGSSVISKIVYYPIEKYLSKYTDVLITINSEDYNLAKKKFYTKNIYLANGVGFSYEKKESNALNINDIEMNFNMKKVIISVGELNKNKNQIAILKALAYLSDPNIHYLVCGSGKMLKKLKKYVALKNLTENVHFLGYRKDVIELLKRSTLFVSSSLREGLPLSIIEAMTLGLPVVCSKIRGHKDLIIDNINGILVNPTSYMDFAEAITILLNDTKKMDLMSLNNIISSKKYKIEEVMPGIMKLYDLF